MSSLKEFLAGTVVDTAISALRRPLSDAVLDVLDARKVPNRTEFKELRNVVDELRGKINRAKRVTDGLDPEAIMARLDAIEARLDAEKK